MDAIDNIPIVQLDPNEAAAGLVLSTEALWNQTEEDWRFFLIKWLPRAPRQTLCVLSLQAGAMLASLAPIFFLNL